MGSGNDGSGKGDKLPLRWAVILITAAGIGISVGTAAHNTPAGIITCVTTVAALAAIL